MVAKIELSKLISAAMDKEKEAKKRAGSGNEITFFEHNFAGERCDVFGYAFSFHYKKITRFSGESEEDKNRNPRYDHGRNGHGDHRNHRQNAENRTKNNGCVKRGPSDGSRTFLQLAVVSQRGFNRLPEGADQNAVNRHKKAEPEAPPAYRSQKYVSFSFRPARGRVCAAIEPLKVTGFFSVFHK
eukprot:TRINITY_DN3855_c0_g1_i1.p1 TRINITY_DN3855_c0_g1~~TRINITY_DN3855_c0_g1_i1.p1  ORF type:complete len:185 (+),score=9.45 TRINITY_DN3855_c0_g1_i1:185-739(+)